MKRPPTGTPDRILIRAPNWLGDLMMATGFVRAVMERWPGAVVDLVVRAGFESLPLPHRGRLLPFDGGRTSAGAFGAALRPRRYDRCYVLPPSFSSAWMARRSGAPERIGYRGQLRGPLLAPALEHRRAPRSAHLLQEYLDLLEPPPAAAAFPPRLDLPPGWADAQLASTCRTLPERFIALAPGAIYGPAKAWPAEHYRAAARLLRERTGLPVVIVGTREERPLGEEVRAAGEGILNWCGETGLPGLVALLARAELLVSNDSGAMHVMAALGRPQVAIFGSTSPAWTGPLNPRAAVVSHAQPCAPCFARTCRFGHAACLEQVTAEEVLKAALALL